MPDAIGYMVEQESLTLDPSDLAPGDASAASFDFSPFGLHVIRSSASPLFDVAYRKLWDEFGSHGGMETRDVIVSRLRWNPARPLGDWRLLYRMIAVTLGDRVIAVRDCTAICNEAEAPGACVAHLSHVLVDHDHRGGGLASWLRAFPVQIARRCLEASGLPRAGPHPWRITLVAEMEHPTAHEPMTLKRLRSYERAGFLKVDPSVVRYFQPDFRDPSEIDASGGPKPLPYQLVLRRVGRESEVSVSGGEVRGLVRWLYSMYAQGFRPRDMEAAYRTLERYPPDGQLIRLLPPTS